MSFLFKRFEVEKGLYNVMPWLVLLVLIYGFLVVASIVGAGIVYQEWRYRSGPIFKVAHIRHSHAFSFCCSEPDEAYEAMADKTVKETDAEVGPFRRK